MQGLQEEFVPVAPTPTVSQPASGLMTQFVHSTSVSYSQECKVILTSAR